MVCHLAAESTRRDNISIMRAIGGLVSIIMALGISLFIYYQYMKQAVPAGTAPGTPVTSIISTTGVEMDLSSIAQAERGYYAQNASYGTMDQLVSSGALPVARTGRDGYTYTLDATASGFTVTAKWAPSRAEQSKLHYPTFVVDQTNQVHQIP